MLRYSENTRYAKGVSPHYPSAPVLNLPNVLTGLRLVLVPVFVIVFFISDGHDVQARWLAALVFAIAAITDRYDGRIARARGQVTTFGKLADPIADKALVGAALISLSLVAELPWWVTIVILVREVGITLLRFAVLNKQVIAASRGGKAKTLLQIVGIGLFILPLHSLGLPVAVIDGGRWIILGAAIVLTISTGIEYVVHVLRPQLPPTARVE